MSQGNTWVLTDTDQKIWKDEFTLYAGNVFEGGAGWTINKHTLHGGLSDRVDVINVDNGTMSFDILPTRGMGIHSAMLKGLRLGWDAPVRGPVHPMFVDQNDRGGLGWLTGFDEMMVRCGLESNGAPGKDMVTNNQGDPIEVDLTVHGKIANRPAHKVGIEIKPAGDFTELVITGEVDETATFLPKLRLSTRISTRVGSNRIVISDRVSNMQGTDVEMQMLYHCNFGPPFLESGSVLKTPAAKIVPRDVTASAGIDSVETYLPPTPGYLEQVYWYVLRGDDRGDTIAMLRNAAGEKAVVLRFNIKQLPCFAQWKQTAAECDGYVTGLEPAVNYPNFKAFERSRGRVVTIAPGESYDMQLSIEALDNAKAVTAVEEEIAAIQGDSPPDVSNSPLPEFSDI